MFGYVVPNEQELKLREYDRYKQVYCGLCQSLKHRFGPVAQLSLNNDMTFLALLQTSLYEDEEAERSYVYRCPLHPVKKLQVVSDESIDYAADMTILLSWGVLRDHWKDDHDPKALIQMKLLNTAMKRVRAEYPRQYRAVRTYMKKLARAEAKNEKNPDVLAGLTGTMLGEIFVRRDDPWARGLRETGFYLGKFIYLMDAWEDFDEDQKKGHFNPYIQDEGKTAQKKSVSEEQIYEYLNQMMAACAMAFESLPLTKDKEILRNIIYAGVWKKYTALHNGERIRKKHESI